MIEAKLELVEARGGDAFTEYSLPEAILKFRQGVGRLIRTKCDSGIVVILDNRIGKSPLWTRLLESAAGLPGQGNLNRDREGRQAQGEAVWKAPFLGKRAMFRAGI